MTLPELEKRREEAQNAVNMKLAEYHFVNGQLAEIDHQLAQAKKDAEKPINPDETPVE